MSKPIDLSGVLSKRSGMVYVVMLFLTQTEGISPDVKAYVAGGVAVAYMVLDWLKHRKDKDDDGIQ